MNSRNIYFSASDERIKLDKKAGCTGSDKTTFIQ